MQLPSFVREFIYPYNWSFQVEHWDYQHQQQQRWRRSLESHSLMVPVVLWWRRYSDSWGASYSLTGAHWIDSELKRNNWCVRHHFEWNRNRTATAWLPWIPFDTCRWSKRRESGWCTNLKSPTWVKYSVKRDILMLYTLYPFCIYLYAYQTTYLHTFMIFDLCRMHIE